MRDVLMRTSPGLLLVVVVCALVAGLPCAAEEPWGFTNVTTAAGFDHIHGFSTSGAGQAIPKFANGVAAGDFDRDGWVDLFVTPGTTGPNRLYRNLGDGTFADVAAAAGVAGGTGTYSGPAMVDLDGDGWLDLWVGGVGTGIRLYKNRGDGTFEDRSSGSGLPIFPFTAGPAFADVDGDRDLDVFIPQWNESPADVLWRNEGDFTFSSITATAFDSGTRESLLYTFTPNFADLDGDGWLDLLVSGDFGWSQVLLARGDGTFRRTTDETVIVDENGMGAAVGDVDGDGRLDWFVTSISGANRIYGNRLYRGLGDGTFEDISDAWGVADGGWGWAACLGDFDNDGRRDLFHVNGWNILTFDLDRPRLFMARGEGFVDEAFERGLTARRQGRGVICFDFDRDGDLDFYVARQDDQPALWRNDGGDVAGAHLAVRLRGRSPNTEGIGAWIELRTADGARFVDEMRSGNNYASQNPAIAYFGLGAARTVTEITVRWPDGRRSRLLGVPAAGERVVDEDEITRSAFESGDLSGWSVP